MVNQAFLRSVYRDAEKAFFVGISLKLRYCILIFRVQIKKGVKEYLSLHNMLISGRLPGRILISYWLLNRMSLTAAISDNGAGKSILQP